MHIQTTGVSYQCTRRMIVAALLLVVAIIGTLLVIYLSPSAHALVTVPAKMNFQGRLTNSSGNILPNGIYNMRYRIFNAASGGTALWTETRLVSASAGVTVTNGLFSVQLGDSTSIPASLFTQNTQGTLYFEIELPTPATATSSSPSWTEGAMSPRNQLASSAYAFNSETLDGLDSEAFAQVGGANTFTGTNTFKPTANSTSAFSIQDSSGMSLLVADTTNDRLIIGNATADSNTTFLAVDSYNGGTADPTGQVNGSIYYNTTSGKFRCYENNTWKDCISPASTSTQTTVRLAVDSAASTTTTLADSGLQFTATAGVPYRFEAYIQFDAAINSTGSRWVLDGPTLTKLTGSSWYPLTATTETRNNIAAYNIPAAANASSLGTGNAARFDGRIVTSATGIVKIRFATELALSAVTPKAGSSLTYWVDQ